jgi:hypothetical protein
MVFFSFIITLIKTEGGIDINKYTKEELAIIKNNCQSLTFDQLHLLLPNRTKSSLQSKIYELGLKPISVRIDWTKKEKETLIKNFPYSSKKKLMELLPTKTANAIKCMARKLGLTKTKEAIKTSKQEAQQHREDLWTTEEDEIVKTFYPVYGSEISSYLPKRTSKTITARAVFLGVKFENTSLWTQEMEDYLLNQHQYHENIISLTNAFNNEFNMGKTYNAVNSKLGRLAINMTGVKNITTEELDFVKQLIEEGLSDKEITDELKWDETRIKTARNKLGILRYHPWGKVELSALYELYPKASMSDIRKVINRSPKMIHWKARELGIERRIEIPRCSNDIYSKNLSEIWSRAKAEEKLHQGDDWTDYEPMTHDEVIFLYEYFDKKCSYCYRDYNAITFDHFIPMTKGGRLTLDNTILCCHSCNTSKQNSDFERWFNKQRFSKVKDKQKACQKIYDYFQLIKK